MVLIRTSSKIHLKCSQTFWTDWELISIIPILPPGLVNTVLERGQNQAPEPQRAMEQCRCCSLELECQHIADTLQTPWPHSRCRSSAMTLLPPQRGVRRVSHPRPGAIRIVTRTGRSRTRLQCSSAVLKWGFTRVTSHPTPWAFWSFFSCFPKISYYKLIFINHYGPYKHNLKASNASVKRDMDY